MRLIAFYLPQFHPIPENDLWWGQGFTEWRSVAAARPLFPGHYQPHIPADLGFYDLRLPETREAQADLARAYGVSGFCYYHYWFNGKRLLQRPFEEVLHSGQPAFPFCLCWANENWTRAWDGRGQEVLMAQHHSIEDDIRHIEELLPAFADDRYLKIDGRPLFLVYRTQLLSDLTRTADLWRERAQAAGFPDLYLARVESFPPASDPAGIGFDAAVEFAPDWRADARRIWSRDQWDLRARVYHRLRKLRLLSAGYLENHVFSYESLCQEMIAKPPVGYRRFRGVTPSWDNSPRRRGGATIFHGSSPQAYGAWLAAALAETARTHRGEEQIVFVNAWNEWGEGAHLEPDVHWGRAYLEATQRAVNAGLPEEASRALPHGS